MATDAATSARVTAVLAVGVAVVQALFVVPGLWQPASLIVGWMVVFAVAAGVVSGRGGPVVVGAVLTVFRVGIEAISDRPVLGTVVSAALLALLIELAAASFDARTTAVELAPSLTRAMIVAAGTGLAVAVVVPLFVLRSGANPAWNIVGLVAAIGLMLAFFRYQTS